MFTSLHPWYLSLSYKGLDEISLPVLLCSHHSFQKMHFHRHPASKGLKVSKQLFNLSFAIKASTLCKEVKSCNMLFTTALMFVVKPSSILWSVKSSVVYLRFLLVASLQRYKTILFART